MFEIQLLLSEKTKSTDWRYSEYEFNTNLNLFKIIYLTSSIAGIPGIDVAKSICIKISFMN